MHRTYENEDIVIFWNSEKCFHAKRCVVGSPKTFDPARRPWIQLGLAENPEVWQAIEQCPSGALSVVYRFGIDVRLEEDRNRSAAYEGDTLVGECEILGSDGHWTIVHTGVRPEYEGRGIAKRLVYAVLEAAERRGIEVSATCSYAQRILGDTQSRRDGM